MTTALVAVFLVAAPGASAATVDCEFAAEGAVRLGDGASAEGDVTVNASGGRARAKAAYMADGSALVADRVLLGARADVARVETNELSTHRLATIRHGATSADFPRVDRFCSGARDYTCGGDDVVLLRTGSSRLLSPGTYRHVRVGSGASLQLTPGHYELCSIELGRDAELLAEAGVRTTIDVAGDVIVGRRSHLGPMLNATAPLLHVGGSTLRLRSGAQAEAVVSVAAGRVRTGAGSTLRGSFCAARARIGEHSQLLCARAGMCGNGLLDQAHEQCDPPRDGACVAACRADCTCPDPPGVWQFTDVTVEAGIDFEHGIDFSLFGSDGRAFERAMISGGAAAGDYDGDGLFDLYAVGGDTGRNHLLRNLGDGRFEELALDAGVALAGELSSGPTFADLDGDGHLDLYVGALNQSLPVVFRNLGDGGFADVSAGSGLTFAHTTFGSAFGDYDGDGDLDAAVAHWGEDWANLPPRLLRNDGSMVFTDVTDSANAGKPAAPTTLDFTFTPNFADLNDDGNLDLLIAADFGTSQVLINDGAGAFADETTPVISDENGMGGAVGDYDNDGDLDWFVSSIYDPNGVSEGNWGITGNRLYRNLGDGSFEDATDEAGVRIGHWGWASCFADFNLDGHLDILHVNGFWAEEFVDDPALLFVSNGDGSFTERAAELGLRDRGDGRGLVCFDYDRDGDVDAFVANNRQRPRLWRNDLPGSAERYLAVRLRGRAPNSEAIGARVYATTGAATQLRELRAGSNFASQDPAEAHFGLGSAVTVDELRVVWPGGAETVLSDVAAGQRLVLVEP